MVDDTFNGEIDVTDDVSSLKENAWDHATLNGETRDDISYLEMLR